MTVFKVMLLLKVMTLLKVMVLLKVMTDTHCEYTDFNRHKAVAEQVQ